MERLFPPKCNQEQPLKLTSEDVILATGPKSGTTWVQQILHGLRSGGSMDYEDINAVIPIFEFAGTSGGKEKSISQTFPPNIYKAHLVAEACPMTAGKYIVVTRNPGDAALSLYHFFCNWVFKAEELGTDEFVEWYYIRPYPRDVMFLNAHQMRHLASWYPHRKNANVLWVHYEDLKADLPKCIRMMSEFLGIGVGDEALFELVERQSSFEFMKQHSVKFDSRNYKLIRNELAGLLKNAGLDTNENAGKVRNGRVNESKEAFSAETLKKLDKLWDDTIKPVTGFNCYEEMRSAINRELGREFKE